MSLTLREPNKLIQTLEPIIAYFADQGRIGQLNTTRIDWEKAEVTSGPPDFLDLLVKYNYGDLLSNGHVALRSEGLALAGRLFVDLGSLAELGTPVAGKYELVKPIATGKNSATFKVRHTTLNRHFVLKLIRPGAGERLASALSTLGTVKDSQHLIKPIDHFSLGYVSVVGDPVEIQCLVFPYIDAPTFRAFLQESPPLSPFFVLAFIEQVAEALGALEAIDAYHGDLHEGNILVDARAQGNLKFYLIDVSFGVSTPSDRFFEIDDFKRYQQHLWHCLEILQRRLPRLSIRKHLGARIYGLVELILTKDKLRFSAILDERKTQSRYAAFREQRREFIKSKFHEPGRLHLLRYEEFTDPTVAVELFEPFPDLFARLERFGNALLFGHRGSGKSTYLAALACFPEAPRRIVDMRRVWGVFFACRQGEFKQFSREVVDVTPQRRALLKHVLVLKILRRLTGTLAAAVRYERLREPKDLGPLYDFLERFLPAEGVGAYATDLINPLENLRTSLLRAEIVATGKFFEEREGSATGRLLGEGDLMEFCEVVQKVFPELYETRFFILFDDAGQPNVPIDVQRSINDLVGAVNSVYCVKLSAERYSYDLVNSSEKALEEVHDIEVFDIGALLFLGSGANPDRDAVERYFREILKHRLEHEGFASGDIRAFLGERYIPVAELVQRLADGRRNAYYAGWEVIWQVADRTARSLLELVSSIFAGAGIQQNSEPKVISARIQHGGVVDVAERKLRALHYVPGRTLLFGRRVPLGRRLFEFATAFGAIAQTYLKRRNVSRYDERIAIERNDTVPLREEAQSFLEALVRYGVLDDSHLAFARDDGLKKPLYILNRIFCPAFKISFRRDQHLRLTRSRFEELLLDPLRFARGGTRILREGAGDSMRLFDRSGGDGET